MSGNLRVLLKMQICIHFPDSFVIKGFVQKRLPECYQDKKVKTNERKNTAF